MEAQPGHASDYGATHEKPGITAQDTASFALTRPSTERTACDQQFTGEGTDANPFIVNHLQDDPENAMKFSRGQKWSIAMVHSLATFALTFASSVYVSGIRAISQQFRVSDEVATLGLSLFVLGFALGPLIWAPLSELYGRRLVFLVSFTAYVAFSIGAVWAPNITALLILRFLASAFGSSTST
jgi:hypothetical protein